jgi:hypothetical protein
MRAGGIAPAGIAEAATPTATATPEPPTQAPLAEPTPEQPAPEAAEPEASEPFFAVGFTSEAAAEWPWDPDRTPLRAGGVRDTSLAPRNPYVCIPE